MTIYSATSEDKNFMMILDLWTFKEAVWTRDKMEIYSSGKLNIHCSFESIKRLVYFVREN